MPLFDLLDSLIVLDDVPIPLRDLADPPFVLDIANPLNDLTGLFDAVASRFDDPGFSSFPWLGLFSLACSNSEVVDSVPSVLDDVPNPFC